MGRLPSATSQTQGRRAPAPIGRSGAGQVLAAERCSCPARSSPDAMAGLWLRRNPENARCTEEADDWKRPLFAFRGLWLIHLFSIAAMGALTFMLDGHARQTARRGDSAGRRIMKGCVRRWRTRYSQILKT